MGSPTIWYYPDPFGTLETITLPSLQEMEELDDTDAASARSRSGLVTTNVFSSFKRWRIVCTLVPGRDDAVIRQLQSFEAHGFRGAPFAFAEDSAKAWAGVARRYPERGDATLLVTPLPLFNASASLSSGDVVSVESASPERFVDKRPVSTFSSSTIVLSSAVSYTFRQGPIAIRWRDYLPAVVKSNATLTDPVLFDRGSRLGFELRLDVVEVPNAVKALTSGEVLRNEVLGGGLASLQQALDKQPPGKQSVLGAR